MPEESLRANHLAHAVLLIALTWAAQSHSQYDRSDAPARTVSFVHSSGAKLSAGSRDDLVLRGVAFAASENAPPADADYESIKALGANTVRLTLGYQTFYDSSRPGQYKGRAWSFLDAQVALAKRHDQYLVLQLCDVEGAQFVPSTGNPFDYRIWHDADLQRRFIGMWRAIAARYAQEPQIAGYSLFCEPVVAAGVEQWSRLAQSTIAEIRRSDPNHLVMVERIYGEDGVRREVSGVELSLDAAFPQIADRNLAYEFYFFERDEYTHQFAPWRGELRRSITYPDPAMRIVYHEPPNLPFKEFRFDERYLRFFIHRHAELGRRRGVPMVVWAFGALRGCYDGGKGGARWLHDVTRIMNDERLSWTAWAYKDPDFGISDNRQARSALRNALRSH